MPNSSSLPDTGVKFISLPITGKVPWPKFLHSKIWKKSNYSKIVKSEHFIPAKNGKKMDALPRYVTEQQFQSMVLNLGNTVNIAH
jgi:hypothetical protein